MIGQTTFELEHRRNAFTDEASNLHTNLLIRLNMTVRVHDDDI